MLAKGYVLGKDALIKAKAFDEYHGVSATAAAKIAELSDALIKFMLAWKLLSLWTKNSMFQKSPSQLQQSH